MWESITNSPLIDALDILIVGYLLYRLIVFIKDTRVIQMFVGLGLLLLLSFLASSLGMIVVGRIIGTLQTVWVIAFIISWRRPTPVSRTVNRIRPGSPFVARTSTSPSLVNLMAFPTRLTMICRNRPGSPNKTSGAS